jgi:hypothetical protein
MPNQRNARIAKLTASGMSRQLAENYVDREYGWAYIKIRPYWHRRIAEHAKATGQSAGDVVAELVDSYLVRGERTMAHKVHWTRLKMFEGSDEQVFGYTDNPDRFLDKLREFSKTNGMDGTFFTRIGAAHEDLEDASTWGPESPDTVDWSDFPAE